VYRGFPYMKTTGDDLKPNPKIIRKVLGTNMRNHRKTLKLSQMDLAREAKLELSTIHRIEAGKTDTNISSLARVREALQVPWKKFLEGI
jgi:predicted transcriptional regulator